MILDIRKRMVLDIRPSGRRTFYVLKIDTSTNHYSKMMKLVRPSKEYRHTYFQLPQIERRYQEDIATKLARVTEQPLTKGFPSKQISDWKDAPFSSNQCKKKRQMD